MIERRGGASVQPVLEARDLHVGFGGGRKGTPPVRAVDGVEIAIDKGQIVALVGESGCGKTTLARTLLGLERPYRGQVLYNARPLSYGSGAMKAYRRKVQLVLQDPTGALNPRRTVYEAVAEGLRIHRVPGDERVHVAEALSFAARVPGMPSMCATMITRIVPGVLPTTLSERPPSGSAKRWTVTS